MKVDLTNGELAFIIQGLRILMNDEACMGEADKVAGKIKNKLILLLKGGYQHELEVQPDVDWDADLGKLLKEDGCD